jgi:hypothetical protein
LCRKFRGKSLHEKDKAYAADAQNQKGNRIINETNPQETLTSDTPETQWGHGVSGEDEDGDKEKEVKKGMGFAQR